MCWWPGFQVISNIRWQWTPALDINEIYINTVFNRNPSIFTTYYVTETRTDAVYVDTFLVQHCPSFVQNVNIKGTLDYTSKRPYMVQLGFR